jgi:hypothetical protein
VVAGLLIAAAGPAGAEGNPHNGLSTRAFRLNALTTNVRALGDLAAHALNEDLFSLDSGYIGRQLRDPLARAVMTDVVRCALDASTALTYQPDGAALQTWRGELGLCTAWHDGPPTPACREIVTACVLARVNALHESIPISLRSTVPPLAMPAAHVAGDTRYRESPIGEDPSDGFTIASFAGPLCVKGHECGWADGEVGICRPGERVELAVTDPATCGAATLRVCDGIHGCLDPGSADRPPAGFVQDGYSKFRVQKQGVCASAPVSFTCSATPPMAGYYTVMGGNPPPVPDQPSPIGGSLRYAIAEVTGTGTYGAAEPDVFAFLEGAFYGDLFQPELLERNCEVTGDGSQRVCSAVHGGIVGDLTCQLSLVSAATGASPDPEIDQCLGQAPGLPYDGVYACYSYAQQQENDDDDAQSAAAFNARLCDLPGAEAKCFPHKIKRCHYSDPARNAARGAGCNAISAKGAYRSCPGQDADTASYSQVITTYLNDPCDVLNDRKQCAMLRSAIAGGSGNPATVPPGARGCGGCAATGTGGLGAPLVGCALVVSRRRRTRRSPK